MCFKTKDMEDIKKTQIRLLEMRNRMYKMYNTLNLINYRLDNLEKRLVNLKMQQQKLSKMKH